jgi:AraC-like DNA-binding protein
VAAPKASAPCRLAALDLATDGALRMAPVCGLPELLSRTLNRRLTAGGTSYARLLARARYDVARELLRDTRLPVQDIALVLGYSGTGPFTHAFRRWSGTTAARWRERHARA